jgi:aldose 1-epimerase
MSLVAPLIGSAAAGQGFDVVTLRSADGSTEAQFVPSANMLCSSLSHRGREFLDRGQGVGAYAQRGVTMGIPLLYPWANRLEGFEYSVLGKHVVLPRGDRVIPTDDAGLPMHGVLPSLMRWEVTYSQPDLVEATLRWEAPDLLDLFPFAHELSVVVRVGKRRLEMATTVRPTAEDRVPVSFGYHPYLRIPETSRSSWSIEIGAFRRLALDTRMIPTGERVPVDRRRVRLDGLALDDAFDALPVPAVFSAATDGGEVKTEFFAGYPYAQIYAPARRDFICFEPMTAPTNALNSGEGVRVVRPGGRYRATFAISISHTS